MKILGKQLFLLSSLCLITNFFSGETATKTAALTQAVSSDSSYVLELNPEDYGFEQQYFFYEKTKNISIGDATIQTTRLRTGYIEKEYIVLSPRRQEAGTAYLSYKFLDSSLFDGFDSITIDLTLWSNNELLRSSDCTAKIEYTDIYGESHTVLDLLEDITLPTDRTKPNTYEIVFPQKAVEFQIFVASPLAGSKNSGRLCIGKLEIHPSLNAQQLADSGEILEEYDAYEALWKNIPADANGYYLDDKIVQMIPKAYFMNEGTHSIIGRKFAYIINTNYNYVREKAFVSNVSLFKIETKLPGFKMEGVDNVDEAMVKITLAFHASYLGMTPSSRLWNEQSNVAPYLTSLVRRTFDFNDIWGIKNANFVLSVENENNLNKGDQGYNPYDDDGDFVIQERYGFKGSNGTTGNLGLATVKFALGHLKYVGDIVGYIDYARELCESRSVMVLEGSVYNASLIPFANSTDLQIDEYGGLLKVAAISPVSQTSSKAFIMGYDHRTGDYIECATRYSSRISSGNSENTRLKVYISFDFIQKNNPSNTSNVEGTWEYTYQRNQERELEIGNSRPFVIDSTRNEITYRFSTGYFPNWSTVENGKYVISALNTEAPMVITIYDEFGSQLGEANNSTLRLSLPDFKSYRIKIKYLNPSQTGAGDILVGYAKNYIQINNSDYGFGTTLSTGFSQHSFEGIEYGIYRKRARVNSTVAVISTEAANNSNAYIEYRFPKIIERLDVKLAYLYNDDLENFGEISIQNKDASGNWVTTKKFMPGEVNTASELKNFIVYFPSNTQEFRIYVTTGPEGFDASLPCNVVIGQVRVQFR